MDGLPLWELRIYLVKGVRSPLAFGDGIIEGNSLNFATSNSSGTLFDPLPGDRSRLSAIDMKDYPLKIRNFCVCFPAVWHPGATVLNNAKWELHFFDQPFIHISEVRVLAIFCILSKLHHFPLFCPSELF